jgi:demethylmenaquinone methyltransferase / 2-methoxy-6-polyprenyl-1,4-benzoquinol methylase
MRFDQSAVSTRVLYRPECYGPAVNTALPPVGEKPRYVAAMFGRIAGRYDLMNTLMTGGQDRAWRRLVAREVLSVQHTQSGPLRVLDVGTGTGKLARAVLDAAPMARVIGVDFTYAMLHMAPPDLNLASADALRLPFADNQFDAVISGFVMRNLADVAQGVDEQVRVLRDGGRLVILETTPGPPGVLRPLFKLYFRRCVPILGQLIAGDASAYAYLPASTLAFLEPARLAEVLSEHGLQEVNVRRLALGSVAVTSARKAAMLRKTGGTP